MRGYTPILMPEDFYLPRPSRFGQEIRDVMPFDNAITYVTDGTRIGVQFRTGRVEWLLEPGSAGDGAEGYRFRGGALTRELELPRGARETIVEVWRRNAEAFIAAAG